MDLSPVLIQKKKMRLKLCGRLSRMGIKARKDKSGKIARKLFKEKAFQRAGSIFTYMALQEEVQTLELMKIALLSGKKIFAPKIKPGTARFDVCEVRDIKKGLKKGHYGILEPRSTKKTSVRALDLIIVPGLAFDRKGNRLGRGQGYFDRFLEKAKGIPKIGLAFKEQLVKKVPVERHDIPVDRVITG